MELLTPRKVTEMLKVTDEGLRRWRQEGTGPPFVQLGYRTVRYDAADLETWIAERKFTGQGDKKDETIKNQS